MANKKYVVKLSAEERERLSALISKGKAAAKTILKARILLKADQSAAGEGWSDERICEALDTNLSMVTRVRVKLVEAGLEAMLTRKTRSTPPIRWKSTRARTMQGGRWCASTRPPSRPLGSASA